MPVTQNEDVYETSDLPEDEQHLRAADERFESDAIERVQLDVAGAFDKFKGKTLATDGVDFSDSLVKRRRQGYGGGSYVLELIGTDFGQPETPEQKFNRLHLEINELSEQLQAIKSGAEKGTEGGSLAALDVLGLQQQLKGLQIEQVLGTQAQMNVSDPQAALSKKLSENIERLKQEKSGKKGGTDGQVHVSFEMTHSGIDSDQKLVALESRLKKIESAVGGGDVDGVSVAETLEHLQQRVQLLDATQLDGLDARLTALVQKLTQAQDKKKEVEGDVDETRVNQLFELITKWDNSCDALPALVDRMHSLQKLHEQAMQFSQALTQLDGVQQQLVKSVDTDSKLLQELKAGMADNMQVLRTNCENLEKRLKAIGK